MDVVTLSFLVLGAIGAGGVVLHYAGYIPRPYRDRLERTETTLAANLAALAPRIGVEVERALHRVAAAQRGIVADIGLEVEGALNRVAEKQRGEMAEAAKAAEAEIATQLNSAKMSMVRSVGVDKQFRGQVDAAMAEAILGPAKPILAQFAPSLLEAIEDNPSLLPMIMEHPLFQKYIAPRLAALLGRGAVQTATEVEDYGSVVR